MLQPTDKAVIPSLYRVKPAKLICLAPAEKSPLLKTLWALRGLRLEFRRCVLDMSSIADPIAQTMPPTIVVVVMDPSSFVGVTEGFK